MQTSMTTHAGPLCRITRRCFARRFHPSLYPDVALRSAPVAGAAAGRQAGHGARGRQPAVDAYVVQAEQLARRHQVACVAAPQVALAADHRAAWATAGAARQQRRRVVAARQRRRAARPQRLRLAPARAARRPSRLCHLPAVLERFIAKPRERLGAPSPCALRPARAWA